MLNDCWYEMRDGADANRVSQAVEARVSRELEDVTRRIGVADLLDDLGRSAQVFRDLREKVHVHF